MQKAIIYILFGILLAFFFRFKTQSKVTESIKFILILMVVCIALAFKRDVATLIGITLTLAVILMEIFFPRVRYSLSSDEKFRTAAFKMLLTGFSLIASYAGLDFLSGQPVPWGFSAHNVPVLYQAAVAFFFLDFINYARHRAQHRYDFLWRFHQIHHSPTEFSTLAVCGRFNIMENIFISRLPTFLAAYLMGISPGVYLWAHAIPFTFFGCTFSHANIHYPWRHSWIGNLINNPAAHGLHHSLENDRRNYGFILLIWDMLFGTYEAPNGSVRDFGTPDGALEEMGILKQHIYTFRGLMPASLEGKLREALVFANFVVKDTSVG